MDTITEFLQKPWVTDLFVLLLAVIIFNLGVKRILEFLANHFTRKEQFWKASLFQALYAPMCFFVWVYAAFWCIVIVDSTINDEPLIEQFQAYLDQHESLQNNLPRFVAFSSYSDSSLDINIMAYSNVTSAEGHRATLQELLFKLHEVVTKNGADFAYPTMSVHMSQ